MVRRKKYRSVKTVRKPTKVTFRTKSGKKVSFRATKIVRKKKK
jgi:hypothetical protein